MHTFYLGLKFAFSFFSILPVSFKKDDDLSKKEILDVMLFNIPLVGLTLGLITVVIFILLEPLQWLGAVIAAVIYMMLYGFLHTEAVIDVADAIYAKHSGLDSYKIIKDSTVGAMGVLYGVATILLKVTTIVYLLMNNYILQFICVLIVSRLSIIFILKAFTFKSSFATSLKNALGWWSFAAFLLFFMIGTSLSLMFPLLLFLGLTFSWFFVKFINKKLGFINGDVLGTTLEYVEIVLFIVVALCVYHYQII